MHQYLYFDARLGVLTAQHFSCAKIFDQIVAHRTVVHNTLGTPPRSKTAHPWPASPHLLVHSPPPPHYPRFPRIPSALSLPFVLYFLQTFLFSAYVTNFQNVNGDLQIKLTLPFNTCLPANPPFIPLPCDWFLCTTVHNTKISSNTARKKGAGG